MPLDKQRASALLFRRRTIAAVWQWLARLGVPAHDRRDVSQEVFLAAHQSFHTYNPLLSRPERWLNRITVHVASHYRERALHRREELTGDDPLDTVDEGPGPDQQLDGEQARELVAALLQELDADLRAVLVAYELDGVPMTEVAERHGIPLSTAYKWRARGRAALRAAVVEVTGGWEGPAGGVPGARRREGGDPDASGEKPTAQRPVAG